MKKNFNINIGGQLFSIDEDAYALLLNYTETLRRYYSRHEEGEEVVDDIEARIAELFNELKYQGYCAITIKHVEDVIQRIGAPEDITNGESDETTAAEGNAPASHFAPGGQPFTEVAGAGRTEGAEGNSSPRSAAESVGDGLRGAWNKIRSGKRFYRDTEEKMLAGVLAGCAKYFGGDVLVWRLVYLAVVCLPLPLLDRIGGLSLWLVGFYLIMAILAPAASSPEEVLKMRGKEVNPSNLAEEVTRQSSHTARREAAAARRRTLNIILAAGVLIVSLGLWLAFVGLICFIAAYLTVPDYLLNEMFDLSRLGITADQLDLGTLGSSLIAMLSAISCCVFIMAFCMTYTALSLMGKAKSMGFAERVGWFIAWLVSIVAIVMTSTSFAARFSQYEFVKNEAIGILLQNEQAKQAEQAEPADTIVTVEDTLTGELKQEIIPARP